MLRKFAQSTKTKRYTRNKLKLLTAQITEWHMCSSKRIGCGTEKAYFFLFLPLYTVLLETHRTTCVYTKNLKSGLKKGLMFTSKHACKETSGLLLHGQRQEASQHDQPFSEWCGPEELHLALIRCGNSTYKPPYPSRAIGTVLRGSLHRWERAANTLHDCELEAKREEG